MTQFLLCGFLGSTGANMSRVWGGTAFAKRSGAMKAPVGLLSGSAVCDSRWRDLAPTSATPTRSLRKCRRIAEVKSRWSTTFSRIESLWPRDGSCPLLLRSKRIDRKQWLEDLVVNQTMQLVKDDAAMESIIAKVMELQNKENTNIPLYEKQLRDAESGIQNMLNAIQAGILTSSTKERLEQLEQTKRELEARIAEEKLAKPKVTEEFIRFWLLRFRKLDMSLKNQRQALADTFINAIYLYDDKVLITFNYKEGTQTVTFGEATEVASAGNGSDLDRIPAPQERQLLIAVFFALYGSFPSAAPAEQRT